ncbi:MAG TPA: L-histidine N(alpha)-methyltransferase [Candidatus Caenarcaniphilales bacterium]
MPMYESTGRTAPPGRARDSVSAASRLSSERLHIEQLSSISDFVAQETSSGLEVINGLSQVPKTLPCRYFYDDRGSKLFEQICNLPEYYPTRTETAILRACAPEIALRTKACELVELGSGSATKTRILLDAYRQLNYPLRYLPIDVSGGILEQSARKLIAAYPTLQVHGLVGTYELAFKRLPPTHSQTRMLCFLGSTLGNLSPQACQSFFAQIRAALQPGEYFLLGVDLQKSPQQLEAAYNDRQGITAQFNLNMLHHLNRCFTGNFDPAQFAHWAFYNEPQNQIEMHLKSLSAQTVHLAALDFSVTFAAGETILTEISRKFNLNHLQQELQAQNLVPLQVWTDPQHWFGLLICQRQEGSQANT